VVLVAAGVGEAAYGGDEFVVRERRGCSVAPKD
jgi:hypothetical protein